MAVKTGIKNCDTSILGTWFEGCNITMREIAKIFLLSPKADIDAEDPLVDATIATLIKKGLLVPLNEILNVTEAAAKNNYQTFANKRKLFISQGLYEMMPDFEANICYVKALHRLSSKSWGALLLDVEGQLYFDRKGSKMKGFDLNTFNPDNETLNDGGSKTAALVVDMQFSADGTQGLNTRRDFKIDDTDSSRFMSILGIQNVKLTANTLAHASFVVKVVGGCDGAEPILGLTKPNFKLVLASTGATVTLTTVTDNNDGTYTIVSGATAFPHTLQLFDSIENLPVADVESTHFYASNVLAVTLT